MHTFMIITGGYKFDIRVYVAVASFHPLQVWFSTVFKCFFKLRYQVFVAAGYCAIFDY